MKKEFTKAQIKKSANSYKKAQRFMMIGFITYFGICFKFFPVAEQYLADTVILLIIAVIFLAFLFIFKINCTHCQSKITLDRPKKKCPHCKIPLQSPLTKKNTSFGKSVAIATFLIIAVFIYYRNNVAAYYFTSTQKYQKSLTVAIAQVDQQYEDVKNNGAIRTLEQVRISDKYDSTTWVRMGLVSVESKGEKISLMYSFDDQTKIEDFIKTKQNVRCVSKEKKILCIPDGYFADEVGFRTTNSLQRSNDYIKKQFARM